MNELIIFFQEYGLPITLIAVIGIMVLGILKYSNIFSKIDEKYRHWLYIGVSVTISVIGTIIYLAIAGQFEINYILTVSAALFALNQAFYSIFKATSINDLGTKILDIIVQVWNKIKEKKNQGQ